MILGQQVGHKALASAIYPGTPHSVTEARRFVHSLFIESPRAYDLELVTAELVTNAIHHTPSGQKGGTFTVTVRCRPRWVRLEVADLCSSPWRRGQPSDSIAEHGRGLDVVSALADEVGREFIRGEGQVTWAVLTW